jgi:hypothetical protein
LFSSSSVNLPAILLGYFSALRAHSLVDFTLYKNKFYLNFIYYLFRMDGACHIDDIASAWFTLVPDKQAFS